MLVDGSDHCSLALIIWNNEQKSRERTKSFGEKEFFNSGAKFERKQKKRGEKFPFQKSSGFFCSVRNFLFVFCYGVLWLSLIYLL
jgi:hypothetical protein